MVWGSLYPTLFGGAMKGLASTLRWASRTIAALAGGRFPFGANDRGANCGLLFAEGRGRRIRERLGLQIHFLPLFKTVAESEFALEFVEREEQEFADEGQVGGIAGRDAVLGDGFVKFAEGEVDVRSSHEAASESGSEFGAEAVGFRDLALSASPALVRQDGVAPPAFLYS